MPGLSVHHENQYHRRVLIVEDEVVSRRALGTLLQRKGYEIDSAASAEEALQQTADHIPEIALIDVDLPGMNGVELAARLRHRRPESVCILITSWPYDRLPKRPRLEHVEYMQKPINLGNLLKVIERTGRS